MPKLIDYPRTNYTGAWELAEVVDDTGGKCAIDTAARKLNRKVSGSFKAIIGSAVKFGLMTSKRELLSTTTLFKRIKHAYDKQEELQFHREAFLTPPLFTQICRKFRGRELPVQMLDVMLIREFGVEEINAQGVAKAFVEGCRMCAILDDHNIMADIDTLNAQRQPRRELASPPPATNAFAQKETTPSYFSQPPIEQEAKRATSVAMDTPIPQNENREYGLQLEKLFESKSTSIKPVSTAHENDAIADLFGIGDKPIEHAPEPVVSPFETELPPPQTFPTRSATAEQHSYAPVEKATHHFQLQIIGPGVNTSLEVTHEEDIAIAIALLEKIRRQLRTDK